MAGETVRCLGSPIATNGQLFDNSTVRARPFWFAEAAGFTGARPETKRPHPGCVGSRATVVLEARAPLHYILPWFYFSVPTTV